MVCVCAETPLDVCGVCVWCGCVWQRRCAVLSGQTDDEVNARKRAEGNAKGKDERIAELKKQVEAKHMSFFVYLDSQARLILLQRALITLDKP